MKVLTPEELRKKRLLALCGRDVSSATGIDRGTSRDDDRNHTHLSTTNSATKAVRGSPVRKRPKRPTTTSTSVYMAAAADEDEDLSAALALSLQNDDDDDDGGPSAAAVVLSSGPVDTMEAFHRVMWDAATTTQEDQSRWMSQGVVFSSEERRTDDDAGDNGDGAPPLWGLVQNHGGPCGVLAAAQAELLRSLFFDDDENNPTTTKKENDTDDVARRTPSKRSMEDALAFALARVLARASPEKRAACVALPALSGTDESNGSNVSTTKDLEWSAMDPWPWGRAGGGDGDHGSSEKKGKETTTTTPGCVRHVLTLRGNVSVAPVEREKALGKELYEFLRGERMRYFRAPGGVLLLVLSLVETRGYEALRDDMDDPDYSRLTSQFGHCSQELLNLLLTGAATSNVFDNAVNVDNSGLVCRGVSARPPVGYLTQLESLRYCSVGSYYKTPRFPVWVLGSQNHFTVLFSAEAAAVAESESEDVLGRCRRAFRAVDNAEENGFVRVGSLGEVLQRLAPDLAAAGREDALTEASVRMLAASLEVDGAGIILWDDFWRATGRMLTGARLETVLQGDDDHHHHPESIVAASYETDTVLRSDEEMARELAARFESERRGGESTMDAATKSDEELARELQARWSSDDGHSTTATTIATTSTVTTSTFPTTKTDDPPCVGQEQTPPPPPPQRLTGRHAEFERFSDTFTLHHYNGLRGGVLTTFKITKLSAEEAVGASVALSQSDSAPSHRPAPTAEGGGSSKRRSNGDLEDVVRTRWPSCVFDWGESENGGGKMGDSLID